MSIHKADDFLQTLQKGTEVIAMQKHILSTDQMTQIVEGLQQSLMLKASSMPVVTPDAAQHICQEIRGSSVLTADHTAKLTTLIASRCLHGIAAEAPHIASKAQLQSIHTPSLFMTHADWGILNDEHRSCASKCNTVCDRMRSIGLTHPTEASYRALAAIVVACHCRQGTTQQWFGIVKELKAAFTAKKTEKVAVIRMAAFPDGPDGLPENIMSNAYEAVDPPAKVIIDGLHEIVRGIPLRISNKAVSPRQTPDMPAVQFQQQFMQPATNSQQQQFMQHPGNFLQALAGLLANPSMLHGYVPPAGHANLTILNPGSGRSSGMGLPSSSSSSSMGMHVPANMLMQYQNSMGSDMPAIDNAPLALSPPQGEPSGRHGHIGIHGHAHGMKSPPAPANGGGEQASPEAGDPALAALEKMEVLAKAGKEFGDDCKVGKAKGKAKGKVKAFAAVSKAKAKAKAKVKVTAAKAKAKVKVTAAKPAAKAKAHGGKLVLGCSKCRGHLVRAPCSNACTHTWRSLRHMTHFVVACMSCMVFLQHARGFKDGCAQCKNPKFKGKCGPLVR